MLRIGEALLSNCQGLTRRAFLRVGALGVPGLTLPDWFRANEARASSRPPDAARSPEVSCIFIWLDGGPSHLETFDPKPGAADTVRGPYAARATQVPGIYISELLPMLAGQMEQCALIRSMNHDQDGHTVDPIERVPMLTGVRGTAAFHGAVLTKLRGHAERMPSYVHLGSKLSRVGGGGILGSAYDPVEVRDLSGKEVIRQFALSADITPDRFQQRRELLRAIDQMRAELQTSQAVEKMDASYRHAVNLLTSAKVREAFDVAREPEAVRLRYGAHCAGQAVLTARRLVEAGTRYVQINWPDDQAQPWDTHGNIEAGLTRLEQVLCPRLDQALSALLEDLKQRGLLRSTLVIATGEFGRTPKLNKYGARDHWHHCFSVLLAGGGIRGGTVIGASDQIGAYPTSNPVGPPQLAATLYRLLGIDTNADPRIRPFIGNAMPVADLL